MVCVCVFSTCAHGSFWCMEAYNRDTVINGVEVAAGSEASIYSDNFAHNTLIRDLVELSILFTYHIYLLDRVVTRSRVL